MIFFLRGPLDEHVLEFVRRKACPLLSRQLEHGQSVELLEVRWLEAGQVALDHAVL